MPLHERDRYVVAEMRSEFIHKAPLLRLSRAVWHLGDHHMAESVCRNVASTGSR